MEKFNATKKLVIASMLVAVAVILVNLTWYITPQIRIQFTYIPNAIMCYLLGPIPGAIGGAVVDILGFFMKPTGPLHLGFTLSALLANAIYGVFFYKKDVKIWRIALAQLIIMVLIDFGLNAIWMKQLYGTPAGSFYSVARLIKNIIEYPFKVGIIYAALTLVKKYYKNMW